MNRRPSPVAGPAADHPAPSAARWLGVADGGLDLPQRIARDVEELLNHLCLRPGGAAAPDGASVLDWGLPSCVGRTVDEAFLRDLAARVAAALTHFEPRLVPGSIEVVPQAGAKHVQSRCALALRARLRTPAAARGGAPELDWAIQVDAHHGRVLVQAGGAGARGPR